MGKRKSNSVVSGWAALGEIGEPDFVRLMAVLAASAAVAMGGLALWSSPLNGALVALGVLVIAVCYTAFRAWHVRSAAPPNVTLALLLAAGGVFALGLAPAAMSSPHRLAQVAAVSLAAATAGAGILRWRWHVGPRAALVVALVISCEIVLIEATVGATQLASRGPTPLRPEWAALRHPGRFLARDSIDQGAPAWSAPAEPDSSVGLRFVPGSTLRTLYPDNPLGYFMRADFRRDVWAFGVEEGSRAELILPPEPGHLRIAIAAVHQGGPEWHVRLDQVGLPIRAGNLHRLEFRARAERSRTAIVAVTRGSDDYAALGLYETIQLTPEWKPYRLYFTPGRDEINGRLHFAFGGLEPSVELADVELHNETVDERISPYAARHPWAVNYRFSNVACRGDDVHQEAQAPERRVLVLGGGFALGVGVHEPDTFAARLEQLLAETTADRVRVLNCGVPGYGTWEQLRQYERLESFRPNLVLLLLDLDSDHRHWELRQRAEAGRPPSRLEQLFVTWASVVQLRATRRTHDYSASVRDIMSLRDRVADGGGRLVVVIAPTSGSGEWDGLQAAIVGGLQGSEVATISTGDMLTEGRSWDQVYETAADPYPDVRVHAALARLLAKHLETIADGATPGPTSK